MTEPKTDAAHRNTVEKIVGPWIKVLPWGWCLHIARSVRTQTFLQRCSDTGLFAGVDVRARGLRITLLRINRLHRQTVINMVEEYEANTEAHGRAVARTVQPLVVHSDSGGGRE